MMENVLIGAGGFSREVMAYLSDRMIKRFVDDEFYHPNKQNIYPLSQFNPNKQQALIVVGDPQIRSKLVKKLPKNTKYFSFIHSTAQICDPCSISVGEGSIIGPNSILTTNIKIGNHVVVNRGNQIGHDCVIGDYCSLMPGSIISGNCNIGDRVYIGTNASIREKINITDDIVIGLNAGVVKDLEVPGVYGGVPTKIIKHL
jgi:sugar O-acyltransferase (sialic acid O-acetyltransferase NeuD family)